MYAGGLICVVAAVMRAEQSVAIVLDEAGDSKLPYWMPPMSTGHRLQLAATSASLTTTRGWRSLGPTTA